MRWRGFALTWSWKPKMWVSKGPQGAHHDHGPPVSCGLRGASRQKHVLHTRCRRPALSHLSMTDLALVISWAKFYTRGSPWTSRRSMGRRTAGHPLHKVFPFTVRHREAGERQQSRRACATSWRRDPALKPSLGALGPQPPNGPMPRSASGNDSSLPGADLFTQPPPPSPTLSL